MRKPGAFAAYRYREELFPTTTFRLAYDQLSQQLPKRADGEYLRVLYLAATTSESQVEGALIQLLAAGTPPMFAAIRELVAGPAVAVVPEIAVPALDLSAYDQLIPSRRTNA